MSDLSAALARHFPFPIDHPEIAGMVKALTEAQGRGLLPVPAVRIQDECRQLVADADVLTAATEILRRRFGDNADLPAWVLGKDVCFRAAETASLLASTCRHHAKPVHYRRWKGLPPENEARGGTSPIHAAVWPVLLCFWARTIGAPRFSPNGPLVRAFADIYNALDIPLPPFSSLRKLLPRWREQYGPPPRGVIKAQSLLHGVVVRSVRR